MQWFQVTFLSYIPNFQHLLDNQKHYEKAACQEKYIIHTFLNKTSNRYLLNRTPRYVTHHITKGWDPLKIKIQAIDVCIPQQEQNTTLRHTSHHKGMGSNTDQDIGSRCLCAIV
jgi:hypothetical protein